MKKSRWSRVVFPGLLLLGLFHPGPAQAEVFYGMDINGGGIYSVDTVSGGPDSLVVTISPAMGSNNGVTLATRPSDNMLFWLDSLAGPNPNLWRWDPQTPGSPPVLLGTPGATTTNVIRLGFDSNNVLYASNGGASGSLWVLNQNNGSIVSVVPLSGATTTQARGDLCLQPSTGTMYVVDDTSLFTITPAGVVTKVATITGAASGGFTGCAFDSKNRLVVSVNSSTAALYQINPVTGAATALPSTPGRAYGDLGTAPNRSADLHLTKTASNATPGNTVSFTITVTNSGPDATFDVRVLDTLPTGLTFVSYSASTGTYTSGTGVWRIGGLASGASATLTINASVTSTGAKANTAQVTYSDMADPNSIPNNSVAAEDDQASVSITPSPDLAVVKSAANTFAVGVNGTYTLTVNNLLGSAASSGTYAVTDNLNSNLTYVSATGTSWSCSAAGQLLTCTSSTVIGVGATNPNPITVTVNPGSGAAPSVSNTATVSGGGEPASNNSNNGSTIVTTVCSGNCPDLRPNKTSSLTFFTPGSAGNYTLSVSNIGGLSTGTNTYTLTDTLPTGLTLSAVPTAGTGWSCAANQGGTGNNTVGSSNVNCTSTTAIAPSGTSSTVVLTVAVAKTAVPGVTNTVVVTGGGEPAATMGNNATSFSRPVNDFDLQITKNGPTRFVVGTTGTYTLQVRNSGAANLAAGNVYTVTDTLPTGQTLNAAPSGTGWTCAANQGGTGNNVAGNTKINCTSTTAIAAGASNANLITVNVNVLTAALPNVSNTAAVASTTLTEAPAYTGNNTSTVVTPVSSIDLIITKTHNGNFTVGTNGGFYTLTVSNIGAQTSSGTVTVTDTLPTGLTLNAAPSGTGWTCATNQGGTGNNVAGNTGINCTSTTTMAANISLNPISVSVNVASTAMPGVTNTAYVTGGGEPSINNGNNSSADVTAVYVTPVLGKAFLPTNVAAGTSSKLTLTITNPATNNVAMTGLAVIDPFPAGMSVAPTPNFSNSCGGTLSSGQSPGDTMINLSGGGSLAINSSCTIQVDVVCTSIGSIANTTGPISSSNSGTGNTATATLTVAAPGSPVLTLSSSPDLVGVNQTAVLTFTVNNKSTSTNDMGFIDTLPTNLVVGSPATFGGTCASTTGSALVRTATAGGQTITVTGFDLAGSATCTITIPVVSSVPGSYSHSSSNIGSLAAGLTTAALTDTLKVRGMDLSKAFAPATIDAHGTSILTFTITNGAGNPYQSGLAFTETLPANLSVASAPTTTQCNGTVTATAGGSTIVVAGGSLALNQSSCTVTVDVTSAVAATYVNNSARISGLSTGTTNSVNASLVVNPVAKATIAIGFSSGTIDVYQPSTMTFTLGNANGIALTNASFTDTLTGFYVRTATIGGTCIGVTNSPSLAAGATALNLTVPSLPAGGCTITIPVTASAPGTYSNAASGVTSNETGGTAGAASNSVTLTVKRLPLQLTKVSSSGPTVSPGGTVSYTIGYSNPNTTAAFQGVVITDPLPPFTTFISASCGALPATLTSCTILAPAVGATGTVNWTLAGSLDAGSSGSVFLSVRVQ